MQLRNKTLKSELPGEYDKINFKELVGTQQCMTTKTKLNHFAHSNVVTGCEKRRATDTVTQLRFDERRN